MKETHFDLLVRRMKRNHVPMAQRASQVWQFVRAEVDITSADDPEGITELSLGS
jgi:hypothetical protein